MPTVAEPNLRIRLSRSIVLVGLMGAGKTSVGKRLAAMLDVPFSDSDHEIVEAAGMEIGEIFETFGESYFREGELRVIRRLLGERPRVIATGGGAFMAPQARAEIKARGVSVWLKADLEVLWNRVKDRSTRPLLQQPEPKKVLAGLLEVRYPVYAEADVTVVSEADLPHEEMVKRILFAVRSHDLRNRDRAPTLEKHVAA